MTFDYFLRFIPKTLFVFEILYFLIERVAKILDVVPILPGIASHVGIHGIQPFEQRPDALGIRFIGAFVGVKKGAGGQPFHADPEFVPGEIQTVGEIAGGNFRVVVGEMIERHGAQFFADHQGVLLALQIALFGDRELSVVLETDGAGDGDALLHERVDRGGGADHQNNHRK